ncbi:MAG: EamA family transporter [Thermodesulfobacteriota bacterium]
MIWFIPAVLTAVAVASQDAWVKRWFSHLNAYEMFAVPLFYMLPLGLLTLLFVPVPPLDRVFAWSFAVSLPINAVPFTLYMKAIRESPLSLTVPYLAFTPVFMIATGYFFLGEKPDVWGVAGIAAVCAGSYALNVDLKNWTLLKPLTAVFQETGSWIMLIVSFIFSFSAVIGKLAILHSSVLFFQMSFFASLSVLLLVLYRVSGKLRFKRLLNHPVKGGIAGVLLYFHVLLHGLSIVMTKAAYMISVKRMSILFSVMLGGYLFDEENIRVRFIGALIMFAGAVMILLAQ